MPPAFPIHKTPLQSHSSIDTKLIGRVRHQALPAKYRNPQTLQYQEENIKTASPGQKGVHTGSVRLRSKLGQQVHGPYCRITPLPSISQHPNGCLSCFSTVRLTNTQNKAPRGSRSCFFLREKIKSNTRDPSILHPHTLVSSQAETIPACRYSFLQEPGKLN